MELFWSMKFPLSLFLLTFLRCWSSMWQKRGSVVCIVILKGSVCKEVIIRKQVQEIKSLKWKAMEQKRYRSPKQKHSPQSETS